MTQPQPGQPMQINIEVPADVDPVYSNFAMITYSPSEVIESCRIRRSPKCMRAS